MLDIGVVALLVSGVAGACQCSGKNQGIDPQKYGVDYGKYCLGIVLI